MAATSTPCGLFSRALFDPHATDSRGQLGPRSVCLPLFPIVPRKNASCYSKPALLPDQLILDLPLLRYGRPASRSVIAMANEGTPAEASSELPEIVTTIKEEWNKLEDKYAVASLVFAGIIALWSATGIISAIDRLPIVPGVLELVGIGYTGWFIYSNLIFKPDREALLEKVKSTYSDIIGNNS
ncbi:protein CURVATURE THYLAKOID 1B, chloroplastic-like isoform X1 [Zingiber officinale]|uniref:protein CURVATURE THYLAKOID 1B, chloroplastic-like isoform X1 n=1 Tax=Zingiber officinale TaxID=94328 RepID=UPI001C4B9CFA|nr:protein CURVATURE THYLAKOID 1B, chloroplastic-like isoform X1 [Zingiber officinale]